MKEKYKDMLKGALVAKAMSSSKSYEGEIGALVFGVNAFLSSILVSFQIIRTFYPNFHYPGNFFFVLLLWLFFYIYLKLYKKSILLGAIYVVTLYLVGLFYFDI